MSVRVLCACGAEPCNCSCGPCEQPHLLATRENRAGLSRIVTRLGTHGSFLAAAINELSDPDYPMLRSLTTRAPDDPVIAMLDGWAVIADVLSFYRNEYANEFYRRTAQQERSLRELAAQVGYKPRPGVSATVPIAYLLDPTAQPLTVSAGARVQSVPKPGEQMQTFETSQPLNARAEWSEMRPRQNWIPPLDRLDALLRTQIRIANASTQVRPGERLLFIFAHRPGWQVAREVASTTIDAGNDCVVANLKPRPGLERDNARKLLDFLDKTVRDLESDAPSDNARFIVAALSAYLLGTSAREIEHGFKDRVQELSEFMKIIGPPIRFDERKRRQLEFDPILSSLALSAKRSFGASRRTVAGAVGPLSRMRTALLASSSAQTGDTLYDAMRSFPATSIDARRAPQLYLMRLTAGAFGNTAAARISNRAGTRTTAVAMATVDEEYAYLDCLAEGVESGSYALIDGPVMVRNTMRLTRIASVDEVQAVARSDYGLSSKVTRLQLSALRGDDKVELLTSTDLRLRGLQETLYIVQSDRVALAPEPIDEPVAGGEIMLDGLFPQLEPGRFIVVAGERADILLGGVAIGGVSGGERAQIASIEQGPIADSPGDTLHTLLRLTAPLTFSYKRSATIVYGNVVDATHGETVSETLGSGDATQEFQRFRLRRAPLTFLSAPTTSGIAASLDVRVNDLRYSLTDVIGDGDAADGRVCQLAVESEGGATIEFGGIRLPNGAENVKATYRVGIGRDGNVAAQQISLATTRPLGVQSVINPLKATGGANRDGPEAIRRNIPVPTLALSPNSRLVSVSDYEHFARAFAGIGDVRATLLSDGRYQCVHVTVAGVGDELLDVSEPPVTSLISAYARFGDPALPVIVDVRDRVTLLVQASLALEPGAEREAIETAVRARLGEAFSFARRGLARPAYRSELIAVLQGTPGISHVDVDVFGGISDQALLDQASLAGLVDELRDQSRAGQPLEMVAAQPARLAGEDDAPTDEGRNRILSAQTAYLRGDVAETLVLNWI